jgi:malate/lactate dehydrogenase
MVTASAAFVFEKWHGLYSTADSMITRTRVGVIGTGRVGMSVAISVLQSGLAEELLLHDIRSEVAEGEAMDLVHGASFCQTAEVSVTSVEELVDVDAVVVTAGRNGRANESRLDLLRDNAAIIRRIGERLVGCRGTIIVVTNPVDVLTAVMRDASGLPTARVQEGACGIRDVALSLPSVVGAEGAVQVVEPEMNQDERDALDRSAAILRRAM